jgi:uncharacterized repeat protein (TIGR03803 family)
VVGNLLALKIGVIHMMNLKLNWIFFAAIVFLATFENNIGFGENFTILHSFGGGADDGSSPQYGTLTVCGPNLYGMTMFGGSNNSGTIFQISSSGSSFNVMHSFTGSSGESSNPDGDSPQGGLTLNGSNLYGMAYGGGIHGLGNVFSIGTDGNGFSVIHSFIGNDGCGPFDDVTSHGSTLYGATYGNSIFRMESDGTGFQSVTPFTGVTSGPLGGLTLCGSTLYGMTRWSGLTTEGGAIYQINTDLTGFKILHMFTGGTDDGLSPCNSTLTLNGSTLYGVTNAGGRNGSGTLFKINLDGSGYCVLHSFEDREYPIGDLTLIGSTLYGINSGGSNQCGAIYKIDTDGSDYTIEHSFNISDGEHPVGGLTLDGSTLYGMTESGGQYYKGTIYAFQVPEPSAVILLALGIIGLFAYFHRRNHKAG